MPSERSRESESCDVEGDAGFAGVAEVDGAAELGTVSIGVPPGTIACITTGTGAVGVEGVDAVADTEPDCEFTSERVPAP